MEKFINVLKETKIFENFSNQEIVSILGCLSAKVVTYKKRQSVLIAGSKLTQVGIVLSGSLRIQKEDINGNVVLVEELRPNNMFGEAFVCADIAEIPVSIWSITASEVMFIDYAKIIMTCSSACVFHVTLIKNMLKTISIKLISLNQKMDIIQKNTLRQKLMAYFEIYMEKSGSNRFSIPFNRNELAEYIGVNRSAMSRELCKMRDEGIIEFSNNQFYIKDMF